jgi:hypothetical protein
MNNPDELLAVDVRLEWQPPVKVVIGGALRSVSSPVDAMHWLLNAWPAPAGQKHEAARSFCIEALAGYGSIHQAREAFRSACEEARILS